MEREKIIILGSGVDMDEIANIGRCCEGPSAPVD